MDSLRRTVLWTTRSLIRGCWLLLAVAPFSICGCDNSFDRSLAEAESLLQQEDADGAIRLCDAALQSHPKSPDLLLLRAQALLNRDDRGDSQQAIDDLSLVIESDGNNQDALYHRGIANMRRQAYTAAVEDFNSVLKMSPQHVEALLQRAEAHLNLAHHESAIADCDAVIAISGDSADAYLLRGQSHLSNNEAPLAEADFSKVIERDAACAPAYWYRALALEAQQRSDEAERDRDRAADLDRRFDVLNAQFRQNLVEGLEGGPGKNSPLSPLNVDIDR